MKIYATAVCIHCRLPIPRKEMLRAAKASKKINRADERMQVTCNGKRGCGNWMYLYRPAYTNRRLLLGYRR